MFVGWALSRGQDANWDLQNYHDYSAYALLTWRYPLDVGPGGFQSYFNPLAYLIPYGLRHALPPPWAAAVVAALQSVVVLVAWFLSRALLSPAVTGRRSLPLVAALTGVTSAMTLAEVGTSFADLMLAPLLLGALLALLRAEASGRDGRLLVLAGLLAGAAAGLKLTNLVFVPGLAAATVLPWRGWRGTVHATMLVGLGGLLGFLLTGGVWCAYLWTEFSNPIFPAFNRLFRSSSAAISNFEDLRFLPKGWLDALIYPARIALGEHPTAENPFTDIRYALALPLCVGFLAFVLVRNPGVSNSLHGQSDRLMLRATVFFGVSYAVWLAMFAIQRYVVALDILAGILLVSLAARLAPRRVALPLATGAALLAVGTTRPADWWHRPWSDPFVAAPPPELATPAAYLVLFYPIGYWASALPAAARFYAIAPTGLATGGVLRDRITEGLRQPLGGQVRTLSADTPLEAPVRGAMAAFGLAPSAPCYRARSLWWVDTVFCAAVRVGERPFAAADLAEDAVVDFSRRGSGWIYLMDGWTNALEDGVGTQGRSAILVLKPATSDSPLLLELDLHQDGSDRASEVEVMVDGQDARLLQAPDMQAGRTGLICLLPGLDVPAGVIRVTFSAVPRTGSDTRLTLTLRTMRLRQAHTGECGR